MRNLYLFLVLNSLSLVGLTSTVLAADLPAATIQKATVNVLAQPNFSSQKISVLQRNASVKIAAQMGLWYQLQLTDHLGYVRVNDVRMTASGKTDGNANLRVLMGGKAGTGRVTETAGVRGLNESDLKSASMDNEQLNRMISQRVDATTAASNAANQNWQATTIAYTGEAKAKKSASSSSNAGSSVARGLLGGIFGGAANLVPKSEGELSDEELALGPEIAGRILGARPLWNNAIAQQRVNLIGRWIASQTSRPELPWTFGIIDSSDINAFAAPGGFILMTRGMYQLASIDSELGAVLAHEIAHVVQRDHYNVIHKQQVAKFGKDVVSSQVHTGGGLGGSMARAYLEEQGATVMMTGLDREAEYQADYAAQIYLVRAGMNPLALYAILQKMALLGSQSTDLAQLFKTHPSLDNRLNRIDLQSVDLEIYTTRE
ncbi:MAG: M48 family metalloprotease [Arenimonas sp.]|nr:M48 family metalloprotease [Arenimonas sp.]